MINADSTHEGWQIMAVDLENCWVEKYPNLEHLGVLNYFKNGDKMLPNLLIIGSQKAGTTSLYHVLKQHPEIYMSEKKEINFFFTNTY